MRKIYYLGLLTFLYWLIVDIKRTRQTPPLWNNCSQARIQHNTFSGILLLGWSQWEASVDVNLLPKLSFVWSTFQNLYSIFPASVSIVVPGPDTDLHLHICLILFPVKFHARRSECSVFEKPPWPCKYGLKDIYAYIDIFREKYFTSQSQTKSFFSERKQGSCGPSFWIH